MIKNKDNSFIGKAIISLIATLGTLALFMSTSGASADVKETPKLDLDANMTKVQTVSDEDLKNHDGQAQDTKKQEAPGQKQPETEESKTTDEETPDYIVITEVVESSEHKQDSNQVVDGVAQTLDPDLLNEILAQTSEVGEYQIYVKNDDELLISGPVPSQTVNEDVNYPTLESSLDSASIYLGQKNRYKLANEEDAQSGLALVEE
ncbi:MAG: signal peptide protein [Streptococcus salivarius]